MDALNLSSELVCLMNWRYKLLVSFNREGNWDPEEWNDESKNHKMCMWWSRCKSKARVVNFCASSLKTQQKYISVNDPEWPGHSLVLHVWGPGIFQRKLKPSLIMDRYLELNWYTDSVKLKEWNRMKWEIVRLDFNSWNHGKEKELTVSEGFLEEAGLTLDLDRWVGFLQAEQNPFQVEGVSSEVSKRIKEGILGQQGDQSG